MARVYRSADRSLVFRRVTLPGERMIGDDSPLGNLITMRYYAEIAAKLAQPILAAALVEDFTVPEEIQFPAFVWEFRFGPLMVCRRCLREAGHQSEPYSGRRRVRYNEHRSGPICWVRLSSAWKWEFSRTSHETRGTWMHRISASENSVIF